jgi:hypothetical protein
MDPVREVYGATAVLETNREWLALLVRMRRQELLLLYNPQAHRAYQELLPWSGGPALWSAGQNGRQTEFYLNLAEPFRYVLK